jgi:hypothetical protein
MTRHRFADIATVLFAIAVPLALAVVAAGPVPFIRMLGVVALTCAALGLLVNAQALGAPRRARYARRLRATSAALGHWLRRWPAAVNATAASR